MGGKKPNASQWYFCTGSWTVLQHAFLYFAAPEPPLHPLPVCDQEFVYVRFHCESPYFYLYGGLMSASLSHPLARHANLVVTKLQNEVLLYDLDRDQASCLNETAALVWKFAD